MKIELKHLAPYLPYGVKCCLMGEHDENENPKQFLIEGANTGMVEVWTLKTITDEREYEDVFPILRPLSDLTKEIEHNGEKFVPSEILPFDFSDLSQFDYQYIQYNLAEFLFEYHFDVFGLIEEGLAININTLSVQNDG